jgi:regulator of protease activity HflC (stomatin/prohibitin superfamily)
MEEKMTDFIWACTGPAFVGIVLFVFSGFRIVQEYERGIVFRLGKVVRNVNAGLNWVIPGIEQLRKVDIRTMTVPIERQETITRKPA